MSREQPLEKRISNNLDSFSDKQIQLARFILDNKLFVSFATAQQIAEKADASAATVVRFAQSLGYEGFSNLQQDLQAELPSYLSAAQEIQERLASHPSPDDSTQQVFYTDIKNIEHTAKSLSSETLKDAVQAIIQAGRIFVTGSGLSTSLAVYLAHSLKVMGFDARPVYNAGLSMAVEFSQLRPTDLVIAIDLWRYIRSTIQSVTAAKEAGAKVITITDSLVSPLSTMVDCAFEVGAAGVAHSLSATAAVSLINVLIVHLSYAVPEQVIDSLKRVDQAYRQNRLLITES